MKQLRSVCHCWRRIFVRIMELLLPKMLWCALLRLPVLFWQLRYNMALAAKGMPAQKQILTNIVAQIWAPAKSSSLASFCSIPITDGGGRISTACWVHPQEPVDRLKYLRGKFCIGCGLGVLCPGF